MIINELFESIDGEACRAGELATFCRAGGFRDLQGKLLYGCNLRCPYCDSKYTWDAEDCNRDMSVREIVEECKKFNHKNITFTGGEPLLQPDADELIETLADEGFEVSIETNGSIDFTVRDWFINNKPGIWVCADYKGPSSKMQSKMLPIETFAKLRSQDALKFVVGSQEDLDIARDVIKQIRDSGCDCYVYLSPIFGNIEPVTIVEYMLKHNLEHKIKFQIQLHKAIWSPERRSV